MLYNFSMETAIKKRIFRDLPATFVLPAVRRSASSRSVEGWFTSAFFEFSREEQDEGSSYRSVLKLPFFDQAGNSLTVDELAPALLSLKKLAASQPNRLFAFIDPYCGNEETVPLPIGTVLSSLGTNIVHSGVLRDRLYSDKYPASVAILGDVNESNAREVCRILEERKANSLGRKIELCVAASNPGCQIIEDMAVAFGMGLRVFHVNYAVKRRYAIWCRDVNLAWFCGEYISAGSLSRLDKDGTDLAPLINLLKPICLR